MNTSQIFESYLPVYDVVPENWEEARPFLVEQLKAICNAVNAREIGFFLDEELLSGKQFIPAVNNPTGAQDQFRSVLRKVINFGTLPNTSTKNVPHGLVFDANFTLVQLFGAATDPVNFIGFPLPWAEMKVPAAGNIQLEIDATNVSITTGSNRSNFTRCFVVIEYLQEI